MSRTDAGGRLEKIKQMDGMIGQRESSKQAQPLSAGGHARNTRPCAACSPLGGLIKQQLNPPMLRETQLI